MDKMSALISSALAVVLQRAGGELTYTDSEFQAVRAKNGDYVITAHVDRSAPGEPVIRVKLEPKAGGKMPVV
jgi:hypothetical protein